MVVIGWNDASSEEPVAHWIIQNSWSNLWGELGRGRVAMGASDWMYGWLPAESG